MAIPKSDEFVVGAPQQVTILAALRQHLPGVSWSGVRKLMRSRRVAVNGVLCLDEARWMSPGDVVAIAVRSLPPPPKPGDVIVWFVDRDLAVVEKPAGMVTLRRRSEMRWPQERRARQPTLDEAVAQRIAEHARRKSKRQQPARLPRLFAVHRLDRDTSGLVVFARNTATQARLIQQFADRSAVRKYLAIVPGEIKSQTISSHFVRDRGDGRRGSSREPGVGQAAITHVTLLRRLGGYCEVECRLETGRTNQIRIHLAELGHPICGDIKYRGPFGRPPIVDASGAPRLALHAAQLQFVHPATNEQRQFDSPWPVEVQTFITRLVHCNS